jgi:hypothetical protein
MKRKVNPENTAMIVKTTDSKGRISLGTSFANVPVRVETNGRGEWVIRIVEAIPAQEAWLLKNKEALNLVTAGILSARKQEFVGDPRKGRNYSWVDEEEDDDVPAKVG